MEGVEVRNKRLEKKYKDILSYKDLINKVDEFEEKLRKMKENSKSFDDEIKVLKDKDQKKVIEF